MERLSVFDIFKIGIGPSSSHTMGPWRAVQRCLAEYRSVYSVEQIETVTIDLFGSLAKTGKGHGTDKAIILALTGKDPATMDPSEIETIIQLVNETNQLNVFGRKKIVFNPVEHIHYHNYALPFHSNGMTITIEGAHPPFAQTYYSIGGGFITKEGEKNEDDETEIVLPFPIDSGEDLLRHTHANRMSIAELVLQNEKCWRTEEDVVKGLLNIWQTMLSCIYKSCHKSGLLPGGLKVERRASGMNHRLLAGRKCETPEAWMDAVRSTSGEFTNVMQWTSCFALAVNEENASFGRVVTAPTNGAAGVIPAVLLYYLCFCPGAKPNDVIRFLLTAGELGSIFKKGATISAAMGGCQAEIGVSSAMAAGALTECLGGSPAHALMAAEIAMEHHLGMTCDPVGGLVQIPCIERNTMGAMKAITAAQLALSSDPARAKISLDEVIKTMWNTALDMNERYKETAEGGLAAIKVPVSVPEC